VIGLEKTLIGIQSKGDPLRVVKAVDANDELARNAFADAAYK
jgi:hypothetical protein